MQDGSVAWLVNAADDFHQGGFSGTVFAANSVNLAAAQVEMHIRQRFDARKFLADVFETQEA
ncbi:hypothetical protein D3C80_2223710 [compost metagenome]